jgi:hypothetical protein
MGAGGHRLARHPGLDTYRAVLIAVLTATGTFRHLRPCGAAGKMHEREWLAATGFAEVCLGTLQLMQFRHKPLADIKVVQSV